MFYFFKFNFYQFFFSIFHKMSKQELQRSHTPEEQKVEQSGFRILKEEEIKNLKTIEDIGSGVRGKVTKVLMKNIYALKTIMINNFEYIQDFIKEYEIMSQPLHPNIVEVIGIFPGNKKYPPSIMLEYCPINLEKAIKESILSKEEIVKIIYQIIEGMKYIHMKTIIHGRLNPTNILITSDGTVKICDFCISKLISFEEQSITCGVSKLIYFAPEILNEEDYYDEKIDVYSFGTLLFFILSGGNHPKIKVNERVRGKKAEIPSSFTEFSKKLINECWNFNPKDRPSFQMILDDLERNQYNLIQLNKTEIENIESFVNNHKKKIPQ